MHEHLEERFVNILLAVDGSDYTRRMLSYLVSHKEWSAAGHSFTALCVVLPVPPRAAAFAGQELVQGYYGDEARAVLEPVRSLLAEHGIAVSTVHAVGHPAEEIAAMARGRDFDLLIMGSHGHGALGGLVLGSVATKVLASCSTPVLLVR